jgi:hypothetical protein
MLSVAQYSLASATHIPEFVLTDAQTKALAEASARVARHYPTVISEKQQDIAALVIAIGMTGFTQYSAYTARIKNERAN